jgi:integrase
VHARNAARGFFLWAITARQMPRLTVPAAVPQRAAPMTQHRRITLLRAILTNEAPPLQDRVAACLMLLHAQPASRLVRLTADDVTRDDKGEVFIRPGDPPAPVPEPFASMLLRLAAGSPGAEASAGWLFPGRWPRHPANPTWLLERIPMGIPAGSGRAAALRQLVLQAPAPVIAKALGYHDGTTTRILAEAGGTWNSYPARAAATSEADS